MSNENTNDFQIITEFKDYFYRRNYELIKNLINFS